MMDGMSRARSKKRSSPVKYAIRDEANRKAWNMPVLVDGYNLLRSIQQIFEELAGLDEVGLCRYLSEYMIQTRTHGHVYFDGTGPRDKSGLGGLDSLEVYFSGPDLEADTLIEEKIEDNSAPKKLIVVSTDRRIQTAANKRKAVAVRSDIFWQQLLKQLDRKKPIPEPKEKRQGVGEFETDQWLDLFGFKKD
jgi:predicted RNA-binding protein with PIN domain